MTEPRPDRAPVPIDVRDLARRQVASLYSHLVTRPTGHAVRLAIESQLREHPATDEPFLSLVDMSHVTVLDFSCADEVVAKLVARFLRPDRPSNVFFVFQGLDAGHLDAIQAVLERRKIAAVIQVGDQYDLVGPVTVRERAVWRTVQERGALGAPEVSTALDEEDKRALRRLCDLRLVFEATEGAQYRSLPTLIQTNTEHQ